MNTLYDTSFIMSKPHILIYIAVMALVTYLIRVLPMVIFRKKITNVRIKSFLYYVPYAVLAAMTFPAVFSSTGSMPGSVIGTITAIILAYFGRSLLTVAISAAVAVLIVQLLGF